MKISTKGRYALRMLTLLAMKKDQGYIALKDIAESQNISKKYLEQIAPMLVRAGLLKTNRGYQGGYMLAIKPADCSLGDILRITEGSLAPIPCLEHDENDCPRADNCPTLFVWDGLYKTISEYVDSITLQDILDHCTSFGGGDYCI